MNHPEIKQKTPTKSNQSEGNKATKLEELCSVKKSSTEKLPTSKKTEAPKGKKEQGSVTKTTAEGTDDEAPRVEKR